MDTDEKWLADLQVGDRVAVETCPIGATETLYVFGEVVNIPPKRGSFTVKTGKDGQEMRFNKYGTHTVGGYSANFHLGPVTPEKVRIARTRRMRTRIDNFKVSDMTVEQVEAIHDILFPKKPEAPIGPPEV